MSTVDPAEASRLTKRGDGLLVDVLGDKHFERMHAHGAVNACVYAVTFVDDLTRLVFPLGGKHAATVLVMGFTDRTREAALAAERLAAAGFRNVRVVRGGLEAWHAAGLPIDGAFEMPLSDVAQLGGGGAPVTTVANTADSKVRWQGRSIFGSTHRGELPLASGSVTFEGSELVAGEFELDMHGMTNSDLPASLAPVLVAHLRSDDFFATDRFPTATVRVLSARRLPPCTGDRNFAVTAALTLRGLTNEIEFDALAVPLTRTRVAVQALITIDRTRWGVLYGSPSFFSGLSGHLVSDTLQVDVSLQLDVAGL